LKSTDARDWSVEDVLAYIAANKLTYLEHLFDSLRKSNATAESKSERKTYLISFSVICGVDF